MREWSLSERAKLESVWLPPEQAEHNSFSQRLPVPALIDSSKEEGHKLLLIDIEEPFVRDPRVRDNRECKERDA